MREEGEYKRFSMESKCGRRGSTKDQCTESEDERRGSTKDQALSQRVEAEKTNDGAYGGS